MTGEVKDSMARYWAQVEARDTARLEHLGAMTPLELIDEALRLDEEIQSTLRAINKHKVNRSYVGGRLDCDEQLWEQLKDRFLAADDTSDPT